MSATVRIGGARVLGRRERCKRGHRNWELVADPRCAGGLARACRTCRLPRNRAAQRRYVAANRAAVRLRDAARKRRAA